MEDFVRNLEYSKLKGNTLKKIFVTQPSLPEYEDFIKAIKPLWDSHWLTNMGEYHKSLENELTKYLDIDYLSLFTNGHLALEIALQAMNIAGKEIITTPFSFASTTHAIVRNNATPVFCDIKENDYTIDENKIEALITKKTCAILPVHVYGNVCNVEKIDLIAKKFGLKIIYDAAHAFGVRYKGKGIATFGDASMLSFHATKLFNTIEGGAVAYSNETLGKELYKLKNFGIVSEEIVDIVGTNAKMNEFQSIMGLCNLKYVDNNIQKRKALFEIYTEQLKDINGLTLPAVQENVVYNYAYYPVQFYESIFGFNRDDIYNILKQQGIFTRKYFYPLISDFQCYRKTFNSHLTPTALKISKQILCLPLYPDLEFDDLYRITGIIKGVCK